MQWVQPTGNRGRKGKHRVAVTPFSSSSGSSAALWRAVRDGKHARVAEMLQCATSDEISGQNRNGETLLHVALALEQSDCAHALMLALPDSALLLADLRGVTPLHRAAMGTGMAERDVGVLEVFLSRIPDSSLAITDGRGDSALHVALKHATTPAILLILQRSSDELLKGKNSEGLGCCQLAARRGLTEVMDDLVARLPGSELSAWDANYSSLTYALTNADEDMALLLVDNMAEEDLALPIRGDGSNALHLAIESGLDQVAFELLDILGYEEIVSQTKSGRSPLHMACLCGREEVALELVGRYSDDDLMQLDMTEKSILYVAAQAGCVAVVEALLLRLPQDFLGKACQIGRTALSAVLIGEKAKAVEICSLLIDAMAPEDLITQDLRLSTPLHVAVSAGNHEVTKMLLQAIPPEGKWLRNNAGQTPEDLARGREMHLIFGPAVKSAHGT